jgi:hypothetical protein
MRTLHEWLGHRDFATTLIYADYQPSAREADLVDDAFRQSAVAKAATPDREENNALAGQFER